ncbi:MAG: ABC transporter permease [Actinobacteria bacterium]|nr:ABC transporter permease [Actinomycetota bacterium]
MTTLTTGSPDTRTYAEFGRPLWRRALFNREMAIIALLLAVVVAASVMVPKFATPVTLGYLLFDVTPILLIALAMAPVMITGDIDLSVGSMVGLSSVTLGLGTQMGLSVPVAGLIALLVGALGGLVNGLLVTRIGLPALAVTIGTLALYRGIAVGLLGTTAITQFDRWWTTLVKSKIGGSGIPTVMIVFVLLLAAFAIMLHFTPFGRGVFSIGLSKDAAVFSGVDAERTRLVLFVLSGLMAALAGIYYALYYNSARGDNATGMELQVIAAVVLGGVSVFGGRGALHGVVAGVLLIGVLSKALQLVNITSDVVSIITGVLLVLSVIAGSVLSWIQAKRLRPAAPPVKTS